MDVSDWGGLNNANANIPVGFSGAMPFWDRYTSSRDQK